MYQVSKLRKIGFMAVAVACLAASHADASTILANWNTFGVAGDSASIAGVGSTNITAISMTRGAGLTPNPANNSFNSADWTGEATDYVEFGFSVAAGYQVSLDLLKIGTRSSNTGPGSVGLFSSLDGFGASIFTIDQSPGSNFVNSAIDLTALGPITGNFVVRLFQIGTTAANGGPTLSGGSLRLADYLSNGIFEDIQFEGTLSPTQVIPEPSAMVLALFALPAGIALIRRRRIA